MGLLSSRAVPGLIRQRHSTAELLQYPPKCGGTNRQVKQGANCKHTDTRLSSPFLQRRETAQRKQHFSLPSALHRFWALFLLSVCFLLSVPNWVIRCLPDSLSWPPACCSGPGAAQTSLPILHYFTLSCSGLPSLSQSVPVSFCMSCAV